ncbi:hypothetical protein [Novosphingobium sp. ERN07]|uniref:hypothetical protein n=1 Tax=Novosphingobium sp. ERN07 TaxID=2726187 RepID=UPI001457544E|nr:hypothetical protein [Novosphingobium sp. ERN07]
MPHRSTPTSRRFEESIHQLTTESIEEALKEIEEALQKRYGQRPAERKKRPA